VVDALCASFSAGRFFFSFFAGAPRRAWIDVGGLEKARAVGRCLFFFGFSVAENENNRFDRKPFVEGARPGEAVRD